MAPHHVSRLALPGFAAFLLLNACSGDSPASPADDGQPTDQEPLLECGSAEHPCSYSEVPIEVIQRTLELESDALDMLAEGATTDDVAAALEAQADVAEVQSDGFAVRFRVDGGRGMWILREGAFATRSRPNEISSHAAPRGSPPNPGPGGGTPARVVVGPESDPKDALVLSPFMWEFGVEDDAAEVAAILSGTRGYEGRVTSRANADSTSTNVDIGSFLGWTDYDVVHFTGHGKTVCNDSETVCRTQITVGLLDNFLPDEPESRAEKIQALQDMGLEISVGETTGREYVVITADFFREAYGSGLQDTFVFLNACQTFTSQTSDMVDALGGSSSVVLGWSAPVYADEAEAAAVKLYEQLSDWGYPAKVAMMKLDGLETGTAWMQFGAPELKLRPRTDGQDLRIRDVVTLLQPSGSQELGPSDQVPILGSAGDDEDDEVPFKVRVEGVEEQFAGEMMVHVTADGVAADPVPLSSGTANEMDQWTVSGSVPLGYDLEDDRSVTFAARATLHDGGESDHEVAATVTGGEPIMGYEWVMEATNVYKYSESVPATPHVSTANLTLTFEEGQAPGEPDPRYVITGGTVTYDYNHTYFDCTFSAEPVTFEVTDEIAGTSALVFHTSTSPVTYTGVISTRGPEFQYQRACEDGDSSTGTHRATDAWLVYDSDEPQPVSADRESITGTYRRVTDVFIGDFIVESNYTITRVR